MSLLAFIINWIPQAFALVDCSNPQTYDERLECLLPSERELIGDSPNAQGAGNEVNLPSGDIGTDFMPFFINTGLILMGTIIFTSFLYAGYLLVFLNDNEENIEKGKKILTYSIVGATVAAIAYAMIYGIANLDL